MKLMPLPACLQALRDELHIACDGKNIPPPIMVSQVGIGLWVGGTSGVWCQVGLVGGTAWVWWQVGLGSWVGGTAWVWWYGMGVVARQGWFGFPGASCLGGMWVGG